MRVDVTDEFGHDLHRILWRFESPIELFQEVDDAGTQHLAGVFAGHRQHAFANNLRLAAGLAQHGVERLLDVIGLAFLHEQDRTFLAAEFVDLVVDHRVGDIHHVDRYLRATEGIGNAKPLHDTNQRIVEATLYDDPEIIALAVEHFIESMRLDVVHCRRPAFLPLFPVHARKSPAATQSDSNHASDAPWLHAVTSPARDCP